MGDSYHPSRGGRDRDSRYPPPRDDYQHYAPVPPAGRNSIRYDNERPPFNPRYDDYRHADERRRDDYDYRRDDYRDNGFSFRGAAGGGGGGRGESYRPPQSDFTFSSDARGPRFPQQQPPPREQPLPSRAKGPKGRSNQRNQGPHQQGGRPGGRPPWKKFIPKPAHNRAILKFTEGDMEPEQMLGMNGDGPAKFVDIDSSDEEDERDDAASEAASVGEGPSRKRVKTNETAAAAEADRPKWSNPDPYSVLPPTDLGIGPKKDIVQSIRKAKVEAVAQASGTNALKDNDDFISFDDFAEEKTQDDDESSEGDDDDFMGRPPPPPPPDDVPPPPPPDGLVMPSDAELIDTYVNGGKKRKRNAEPDTAPAAGEVVEEWLSNGTNPTPWVSSDSGFRNNVGMNLHREILDFYDYVAPRDYEKTARLDIIDRVQRVIRTSQGGSNIDVRAFGSFASGLYLPTADMDLVAVSRNYMAQGRPQFCQSGTQKHRLARKLTDARIPKDASIVVITRAKVPIIKFVDDKTDIKVDISFENDSGLRAIPTFESWSLQYPQMPKLVVIIKQFLAMRGMNEVFSGGIGGFTIICLVTSMLQLNPPTQQGSAEVSLGDLLLHFFDLYGNKFDLAHVGIEMNPPRYFDKDRYAGRAKVNHKTLSIIDPNRPDNDISGGSRHVRKIFDMFRGAHAAIQRRLNDLRTGQSTSDSILGCILGGNYSTFEEQRDLLSNAVGRPNARPPPQQFQQAPPAQSYYNAFPPPPPGVSGLQNQQPLPPPPSHFAPPAPGGQTPVNQPPKNKKKEEKEAQRKAAKKAAKKAKKARKTGVVSEAQQAEARKTLKDTFEHKAKQEGFILTKNQKKAMVDAHMAGDTSTVQRLLQQARNNPPLDGSRKLSKKRLAELPPGAKTSYQKSLRDQRANKRSERAASADASA